MISDQFGRDPAIAAVFLVGISAFGTIVVTGSFPVIVAATVLIGVAMSGGPSIHSRALDRLDSEEQGVGFGLFRSTFMLLGSLSPLVIGAVVDVAGWEFAYGLVGGALTVGVLVIVTSRLLR